MASDRWSSRPGFLLATVGAAVDLGNIWRFAAVLAANGGGAYLVPYLLAAFGLAVVMPTVFALPIGLVVYAATLPGWERAVGFPFTPDFAVLADPGLWSAAVGQVFSSRRSARASC
jgi:SNF family Na+-dependent transporter